MFCYKCGGQLPDQSLFCNHCGVKMPDITEDEYSLESQTSDSVDPQISNECSLDSQTPASVDPQITDEKPVCDSSVSPYTNPYFVPKSPMKTLINIIVVLILIGICAAILFPIVSALGYSRLTNLME